MIFLFYFSFVSGKCILSTCTKDNVCDLECNDKRCFYDFGDCGQCSEGCLLNMIGDDKCDVACFNEACNYDGFDCMDNCNEFCSEMYIGDGICDEECNNASCDFDGGDCDGACAPYCYSFFLGDFFCDFDCFNLGCNFDYGDCDQNIYVSPGSTGSGSESDPFGTIKEAFDSIIDEATFYNIYLSPGVHYIDNEITLLDLAVGINILGNNSEIRIINLTNAFNFSNILYFEISQVTFDGSEYWELGCDSNICRFIYQWNCETVCSSWRGEEIPANDNKTLEFWKNCLYNKPLSVFTLNNVNKVTISEVNIRNFGYFGSLVNATGCSIEANGINISNSEVFDGIIYSSAKNYSANFQYMAANHQSYIIYMKAIDEYLVVNNMNMQKINLFNNPFIARPCFRPSYFAAVYALGINNITLSNFNFIEVGSNNIENYNFSGLIQLENSLFFSINNINLYDSVFNKLSLIDIKIYPSYFFFTKSSNLIQNIKIENAFAANPLIRVFLLFHTNEIVIRDVEVTNSTLYTNLINALVSISTPENTEFTFLGVNLFKAFKFDKYFYIENLKASYLYLKKNLLSFNNTNLVQISNYSISYIRDEILAHHKDLTAQYEYISSTNKIMPINFLSFLSTNVVELLNGSVQESNTNCTVINFDSIVSSHLVNHLQITETLMSKGIFVFNGTLGKVSLSNLQFDNSFFNISGIFSEKVSNIEIKNSQFTNMKSTVVKLKADNTTISNSKFLNCNSQDPLVYLMPLYSKSKANLIACEFFYNTGHSPIDTYIDSGQSEMTALFKDCIFSGSFGTSPISFAFSPNSEVDSIEFDNCTITEIVSNNYHGAIDVSLNKGKAKFTKSKFLKNSCTKSINPVVFHNNENSEKISFVDCQMQDNRNDIFFVQNNILVKQNNEFVGCEYLGNKAVLLSLRNSDSLISDSQFKGNELESDLIAVNEKSSLLIENSEFTGNVSPDIGVLIKVSAAKSFNCKNSEFYENLYSNTFIFDLSSTKISLIDIKSAKNTVYNLISSSINSLDIFNFTSDRDHSSAFLYSKNSILSIQSSQFINQKQIFEIIDNEVTMNSVMISGIDQQVFKLVRSSMVSYGLSIEDSPGMIAADGSDLDFYNFYIRNSSGPIFESSSVSYSQSSFSSTNGLICEDVELTVLGSKFEYGPFAMSLSNSKLKMKDSRIAYSKYSGIQATHSELLINNSEFFENYGKSGGGLVLDNSDLSLFSCNLTKNSALDGGGIFYSNSTFTEENSTYISNSAIHGDNIATPFSYLKEDPSNIYNVSSGEELTNLKFYLKDELDQTIFTDNSSILSLIAISDNSTIRGSGKIISTNGEVSLEGIKINAEPGSTQGFFLFYPIANSSLEFVLEFRKCVLGEILELDNSCNLCGNNTYSIDKNDRYCKPCPFGAICPGGSKIFPDAGYWASQQYPENIYPCLNPLACIEGSNNAENNCAFSYDGVLCATCIPGYKLKGSYNCTKCPKYWISWLIVVISGILVLGFVAFMVYFNIKNLNKSKSEIALLLKILVNYCQTIVVLASIDLKWPSSILNLFDFSTAIGESSTQVLSLSCTEFKSDTKSSYKETLTTLMFPIIVILTVFFVWSLVSVLKKSAQYIRVHFVSTCVVIILLMHTSVSNTILSVFSCKKVNGEYWNTSDYNLKCFVDQHLNILLYIGLPGLIIWCISLPSVMFVCLFKNRRYLDQVETLVKFKTLFSGYKPEFYYWEFLVILRKFLIRVIAILLISSGITIQGLGIMIVLLFSLSLHINYKPYEKDSINKLEQYCIIVLILFICGGITFSTDIQDRSKVIIGWILFVVNIMFLLYWGKFFFKQVFDILGKTNLYTKLKNRFFFRKKNKINVNVEQGVRVECTYKSGVEEPADRSLDFLFPKNPSNSCLGVDEFQPKCNVWTVRCEAN